MSHPLAKQGKTMAWWRAGWLRGPCAIRPGLLVAARGPAKPGGRAGPAGGNRQARPIGRLGCEASSSLSLLFLFYFSSSLLEFKFDLEFEFISGVPYSLEFLDMRPPTLFYIY